MSSIELLLFLYGYLVASLLISLWIAIVNRGRNGIVLCLVFIACVAICSILSLTIDGTAPVEAILTALTTKKPRPILSAALGFVAAMTWSTFHNWRPSDEDWTVVRHPSWYRILVSAVGVAGVTTAVSLLAWDYSYDIQMTRPKVFPKGLTIRKVAELSNPPVRLTVGHAGTFYVSTYFTDDSGRFGGAVEEFNRSDPSVLFGGHVAASSHLLYRPFGMAMLDGDIYVSRSGHDTRANNGVIRDLACGAITCLKDLDGDGYFEYADDVVQELPGTGGPDTMHQNNGIAFDDERALYVAIGTSGDREIDERLLAGTVLKIDIASGRKETIAQGFRNPFGIAVDCDGNIFVTDNDSSDDPGDELNHVIPGEHYGHPFVAPGDSEKSTNGFRDPILTSVGNSNYTGIAFANGDALPAELRGKLLLCDMGNNRLLAVSLKRHGDTFKCANVEVIAEVHSPVDVAVGIDGVIYVASRFYKTVYAITTDNAEYSASS